ncbi:Rpn family recombination-promoting nuclease/putative transposase [Treponema sp.]|uniref:Rpn family recombination-promoting nuclease/putative transposase n=1 Tax=Treponema sp. TaxID=166 RepID=UPI00298D8A5C|nr:Rpn family recombination-promoting nuclease/putative transposase [Treponema sp.]MCR5613513.1 Rpn family recombination-promoting nuclease/putative transposase [Treponema sp.]
MTELIRKIKTVDELTFTDDGMFQAVLHEPDLCAELVERLLHINVSHVEYPELEAQIAPYFSSKGVRLDVFLKDSDKVIDVEMQTIIKPSLGKRLRYYQSMLDIDSLMKGQKYSELKESYILFICKEDPFKDENGKSYGLSCYSFKNTCLEKKEVNLHDNSLKVVYNASAYEKEKDEKIKNFLHFINTNEPGEDDFSSRLSATVERLKNNDKFRSTYLSMNLHDFDIREEGRLEGAQQKAIETAKNLYANGVSIEIIAKSLGMTEEQIKEIVNEK